MGRRAKPAPARKAKHRGHPSAQRTRRRGDYSGEDFADLVQQLRPLGLFVRRMDMDGNCLFRAFADQVGGDCEEHQQYRDESCEFILEHIEEFELFHADEDDEEGESFHAYVQRMRHPGRWGSQLELMALCQRYSVNAILHQSGRPAYEMVCAPREARCIQLSYHDGEHYNSVRFAWDLAPGQPAQYLSLLQLKGTEDGAEPGEEGEEVRQVRECLPPEHEVCAAAIRAALARASGDVACAAEYLLMEDLGLDAASTAACGGAAAEEEGGGRGTQPAPGEPATASSREPRADKRAERRQAKEAADQQRRRSARASAKAPDLSEASEKLALLGKQLLPV